MNSQQIVYSKLNLGASRTAHSIIKKIVCEMATDHTSILDVGCADGMVAKLTGFKGNVTGVEYDEILANKAREHYKSVIIHNLDFPPLPLDDKSSDLIVAGDVIEHCRNDLAILQDLFRILKDNGRILISLPNIAQLPVRLKLMLGHFKYTDGGVLCREHLHFYTESTMKALVKEAGFKVEKIMGAGFIYSFVPIWRKLLCPQMIILARKNGS